jgi:hypothetical protein
MYDIDYESQTAETKINIWTIPDSLSSSLIRQRWSYKQFFSDKLAWEYTGYAIANDSSSLTLFLDTVVTFFSSSELKAEKVNKRMLKKYNKAKPFYIVTKEYDFFYIEGKQRKGSKAKTRLIKTA